MNQYSGWKRYAPTNGILPVHKPLAVADQYQSIASSAWEEYRLKATKQPWILSYDNMNYHASVKMLLLHKTSHVQSDTAGYVYFPSSTSCHATGSLPRSISINRGNALLLMAEDLSPDSMCYYQQSAKVHMYHTLRKYFPTEISNSVARNKVDPEVITLQPIHLLPVRTTDIYTLPILDLNEALVDETIKILKAFVDELGIPLPVDSMADKIVLIKGDWLTIRNINLSLFQRHDAVNQEETFDFLERVMGLFHLQMNVLKLMIRNYWG